MNRFNEIKESFKDCDISGSDTEWLIKRIEDLEAALQSYCQNLPKVITQKNSANLHFILMERLKMALEGK